MNISFQTNEKNQSDAKLKSAIDANSECRFNEIRSNAFQRYLNSPLPSRKLEHWKYNNMSFLSKSEYLFERSGDSQPKDTEPMSIKSMSIESISDVSGNELSSNGTCIELLDGMLINIRDPDPKVKVTEFRNATEQQSQLIVDDLCSTAQQKNLLINLNTALASDGLLIEVDKNSTLTNPITIVYKSSLSNIATLTTYQTVIHCGEDSNAEIVEQFITPNSETNTNSSNLALQQTTIHLTKDSRCHHYRLNMESPQARQVSRAVVKLDEKSIYNGFYFSQGSQLNKTDIDILHQGKFSSSDLTGVYLPSNEQCIDYHTNVEHQVANCISREVFRGIIADSAKATFSGKIHIFKHAQKTDAQLSNKNLLLTNLAEINTKPELEIYADDVVCAHGATVAKIDEQAIYYLQTRGVSRKDAKRMLSHGFIKELLDKIGHPTLKETLSNIVLNALSNGE